MEYAKGKHWLQLNRVTLLFLGTAGRTQPSKQSLVSTKLKVGSELCSHQPLECLTLFYSGSRFSFKKLFEFELCAEKAGISGCGAPSPELSQFKRSLARAGQFWWHFEAVPGLGSAVSPGGGSALRASSSLSALGNDSAPITLG